MNTDFSLDQSVVKSQCF